MTKRFPPRYQTRSFITVFITGLRWFLSSYERIKTVEILKTYSFKIQFNKFVTCCLRLGLPGGLFPLDFPTKILYAVIFSTPSCDACPTQFSFFICSSSCIWRDVQIMEFSSSVCYFQRSPVNHLQSTYVVPYAERPRFTSKRTCKIIFIRAYICLLFNILAITPGSLCYTCHKNIVKCMRIIKC